MPLFEYVCNQCSSRFEALVSSSRTAECPRCSGSDLTRQLSTFAVGGGRKEAAPMPVSPCGACGDPRGPGSCSRN